MSSLNNILDDVTTKFADAKHCGRRVPDWLRKQVDAMYEMETDPVRGLASLADGLGAEQDYLEELWKKSSTHQK